MFRPDRSERRFRVVIATSFVELLRRPIESATEGLATALDPASTLIHTRLLIIHGPETVLAGDHHPVPHILADKVIVVVDQSPLDYPPPYDLAQTDQLFRAHFGGEVFWAPVDEDIRRSILEYDADVQLLATTWTPSLALPPWRTRRRPHDVPIIGRSSLDGDAQWPESAEALAQIYPSDGQVIVRIMTASDLRAIAGNAPPAGWQLFRLDDTEHGKYIDNLDFFVYFATPQPKDLPTHAIIEAMARGVVTILPHTLKNLFGSGALYARPPRVHAMVQSLFARSDAYDDQATHAARQTRQRFGANIHKARLRHLIGESQRPIVTRRKTRPNNRVPGGVSK